MATDVGGAPGIPRRGRCSIGDGPRPGCSARSCPAGVVVVNADDPNAEILGARQPRRPPGRLRDGAGGPAGPRRGRLGPDRPARRRGHADGPPRLRSRDLRGSLPLVGPRAAACALAAAALAWALEIDRDAVVAGLEAVRSGRRAPRGGRRGPGLRRPDRRGRHARRPSRRPWPPSGPSAPGGCIAS